MNVINDEGYFDYLTILSYHIGEILEEKNIDHTNMDLIKKYVGYEELLERAKDDLTDETGFILNEYECKQLYPDAIEWFIYWRKIWEIAYLLP